MSCPLLQILEAGRGEVHSAGRAGWAQLREEMEEDGKEEGLTGVRFSLTLSQEVGAFHLS